MMTRKTAKRKKGAFEAPLEVPQETTASEPVQPEETQSIPNESRVDSMNVGRGASSEVEEHDPTPGTPVESAYTTPSSEPRRRQMSTSTRARGHSPFRTVNPDGESRSRKTKRRRTRTLSSTLRLRFILIIKRQTMLSA
jgi:hypothetical protein